VAIVVLAAVLGRVIKLHELLGLHGEAEAAEADIRHLVPREERWHGRWCLRLHHWSSLEFRNLHGVEAEELPVE
jgi:hypothetical protein